MPDLRDPEGAQPAEELPTVKTVLLQKPPDHQPVIARAYSCASAFVITRPAKRFAFPAQYEPLRLLPTALLFKSQPLACYAASAAVEDPFKGKSAVRIAVCSHAFHEEEEIRPEIPSGVFPVHGHA